MKKRMDQVVVSTMANVARKIAKDSTHANCWVIAHHPKEPKDLAARLLKMQSK